MLIRPFRKRINNTIQSESKAVNSSKISLLVVDDSLAFLLITSPDVILLDKGMPLMDGLVPSHL